MACLIDMTVQWLATCQTHVLVAFHNHLLTIQNSLIASVNAMTSYPTTVSQFSVLSATMATSAMDAPSAVSMGMKSARTYRASETLRRRSYTR